jgi:hypothetical protein
VAIPCPSVEAWGSARRCASRDEKSGARSPIFFVVRHRPSADPHRMKMALRVPRRPLADPPWMKLSSRGAERRGDLRGGALRVGDRHVACAPRDDRPAIRGPIFFLAHAGESRLRLLRDLRGLRDLRVKAVRARKYRRGGSGPGYGPRRCRSQLRIQHGGLGVPGGRGEETRAPLSFMLVRHRPAADPPWMKMSSRGAKATPRSPAQRASSRGRHACPRARPEGRFAPRDDNPAVRGAIFFLAATK